MLPNQIYHIYNRGNNRQIIFFNRNNYLFFLEKIRIHLLPTCNFLAYCLMPNHFHFLIKTDERTISPVAQSNREIAVTAFSKGLQILLSSYAQAIQRQEQMTGSLFQQKTKKKQVSNDYLQEDYTQVCFRYILQNPKIAGLVERLEDWEFSSYRDFVGLRNGTLCNKTCIYQELGLEFHLLEDLIDMPITKEEVKRIW